MAVNFASLLSKKATEVKRPPALPGGLYPGIIKGFAFGESEKKKTPYVQFQIGYTGWAEGVEPEARVADGKPIDLSKKTAKIEFYLTEDAIWRLGEFLQALHPGDHRSMEELVPQSVGSAVYVDVTEKMGEDNNTFNETKRVYTEAQYAEAHGG